MLLSSIIAIVLYLAFSILSPQAPILDGYEEAGESMKAQIKEFDEHIHLEFNVDEFTPDSVDDEWLKLQQAAFEVTDDPLEGDYMYRMGDLLFEEENDGILEEKKLDGTYDVTVDFTVNYLDTKEQEEAFVRKADEILESLDLENDSDYDKVRKIYDYICSNVTYDDEHVNDESYDEMYTAYAAACKGTAVCAGIIRMFYYMAKSEGIDVRLVERIEHTWAFAKIDGKYYYLDPTWDLGYAPDEYEYFLRGSKDFLDHEGDENLSEEEAGPLGFTDRGYDFAEYKYTAAGAN